MPGYGGAFGTHDLPQWEDEAVEELAAHVARHFDGSVGIMATRAITSGSIGAKRDMMRMFFEDKVPGGAIALREHLAKSKTGNVPGMPLEAPTLEEWENLAFDMAGNKMACMSPSEIERYAATTGLPLDEVRRQLWKVTFDASLRDSWQRKERGTA